MEITSKSYLLLYKNNSGTTYIDTHKELDVVIKEFKKQITDIFKSEVKEEDKIKFKNTIQFSYLSNKNDNEIGISIIRKYKPTVKKIDDLKNKIIDYLLEKDIYKINLEKREIYNENILKIAGFKPCQNCNGYKENIIKKEVDSDNKFAILATMSSGKSTLINALLGRDLLPSENQACTGKIFEISNLNSKLESIETLKDDEIVSEQIEISSLKNINNDNSVDKIRINTNFFEIKRKIVLYDTPGVNNYMNENHQKTTYDFLEKNDIKNLIYILNATQIGVVDDKKFLIDLKELMQKQNNKIYFILNKMDTIDSKYEEKDEIIKNVKKYLEEIGFKNPILVPTSAQVAKILRKGMNNNLETRREKIEFKNYIDSYLERNNLLKTANEVTNEVIQKIILETGIKKLELLINKI
ncbi:MAG: dynamin family protein [Fusobacteriaceae bacterium]